MNVIMKPNDRVFFTYGRKPYLGTIISIDFPEAVATVGVDKPGQGMGKTMRVFLTELVATQRDERLQKIEEALESQSIVLTCSCEPNNCKHED